jgi:hypothetical protein
VKVESSPFSTDRSCRRDRRDKCRVADVSLIHEEGGRSALNGAVSWELPGPRSLVTRRTRFMAICRYLDGASRTRTGGLLGAIQEVMALEFRLFAGVLRWEAGRGRS